MLDKEQQILTLQSESTVYQAEIKSLQVQLDLTTTKLKALEAFSTTLQQRYDKLERRCSEKEAQLNDLMSADLS